MIDENAAKKKLLKNFGLHVEKLISKNFESKEAFIRESGIWKANLHEILTGQKDIRFSTIKKIADGFGIPLKKLFEGMEKD